MQPENVRHLPVPVSCLQLLDAWSKLSTAARESLSDNDVLLVQSSQVYRKLAWSMMTVERSTSAWTSLAISDARFMSLLPATFIANVACANTDAGAQHKSTLDKGFRATSASKMGRLDLCTSVAAMRELELLLQVRVHAEPALAPAPGPAAAPAPAPEPGATHGEQIVRALPVQRVSLGRASNGQSHELWSVLPFVQELTVVLASLLEAAASVDRRTSTADAFDEENAHCAFEGSEQVAASRTAWKEAEKMPAKPAEVGRGEQCVRPAKPLLHYERRLLRLCSLVEAAEIAVGLEMQQLAVCREKLAAISLIVKDLHNLLARDLPAEASATFRARELAHIVLRSEPLKTNEAREPVVPPPRDSGEQELMSAQALLSTASQAVSEASTSSSTDPLWLLQEGRLWLTTGEPMTHIAHINRVLMSALRNWGTQCSTEYLSNNQRQKRLARIVRIVSAAVADHAARREGGLLPGTLQFYRANRRELAKALSQVNAMESVYAPPAQVKLHSGPAIKASKLLTAASAPGGGSPVSTARSALGPLAAKNDRQVQHFQSWLDSVDDAPFDEDDECGDEENLRYEGDVEDEDDDGDDDDEDEEDDGEEREAVPSDDDDIDTIESFADDDDAKTVSLTRRRSVASLNSALLAELMTPTFLSADSSPATASTASTARTRTYGSKLKPSAEQSPTAELHTEPHSAKDPGKLFANNEKGGKSVLGAIRKHQQRGREPTTDLQEKRQLSLEEFRRSDVVKIFAQCGESAEISEDEGSHAPSTSDGARLHEHEVPSCLLALSDASSSSSGGESDSQHEEEAEESEKENDGALKMGDLKADPRSCTASTVSSRLPSPNPPRAPSSALT